MRTDVRHRNYPRRHRPSTMMVRYGRVFLVQGGFNVCCIFDDALVVTKNLKWVHLSAWEYQNSAV
jgi:hypothetical protein